jgi:hypothetical protein
MSDSYDIDSRLHLSVARDRLRRAAAERLAAVEQYNAAEQDLLNTWMSTFGSDRYKQDRFSEDQKQIKSETGANW